MCTDLGINGNKANDSTGAASALGACIAIAYLFELKNKTGNLFFSFNTSVVLLALLVIAFSWSLFVNRIYLSSSTGFVISLWLALFCLAVLTGLWSEHPDLVLSRSLLIFTPSILITMLVLMDRAPRKTFFRLLKFLSWLGFCLALYGLILRFAGTFVPYDKHFINQLIFGPLVFGQKAYGSPPLWRISSLKGNPNSLALVLLVTIWASYVQFKATRIKLTRYYTFISVQGSALCLTFSRTGIGAAVLMCVLFYFISEKKKVSKIAGSLAAITLLALFILIIVTCLPQNIISALEQRTDVGLNARDRAWVPILNGIMEKPLGGAGFAVVDEAILKPVHWNIGAHNVHLTVMSEIGLPGYAVFILLWFYGIISGIRAGLKKNYADDGLIALSAGVLLACLLFHQFFEDGLMRICALHFIWVYLIAIVAVFSRDKKVMNGG